MNSAVIISALLSSAHVLTLALGLGAIFIRGRALAGPLDEAGWRRLLTADNAWGIAAVLWIGTGLLRVFFGGKEPAFYWGNGFFWVKMALFGLVFVLEIAPMMTFIRVRSARPSRRAAPSIPRRDLPTYQFHRVRPGRGDSACRITDGARGVDVLAVASPGFCILNPPRRLKPALYETLEAATMTP